MTVDSIEAKNRLSAHTPAVPGMIRHRDQFPFGGTSSGDAIKTIIPQIIIPGRTHQQKTSLSERQFIYTELADWNTEIHKMFVIYFVTGAVVIDYELMGRHIVSEEATDGLADRGRVLFER